MKNPLLWAALLPFAACGCEGAITTHDSPNGVPVTTVTDVRWRGQLRPDASAPPPRHDAGSGTDAGTESAVDSGGPADSGAPTPTPADGGAPTPADSGAPSTCVGAGCTCVRATLLWYDDFETGDYSRWTSGGYGDGWGDSCQNNALSTLHPHSGTWAQRNEIVCASSSPDGVHRGYGGLQWSGDTVLPAYTNSGVGLSAPNGIVTTFWDWIEAGYSFGGGRWISLFTIKPSCDPFAAGDGERVITLGIDQADGILRAAHYWPEGTETIDPAAPACPRGRWVRVTVYLNLETGTMHVWQDGTSVWHITGITRTTHTMCGWHWGLYASGNNTDVVMYEDDKVVWRLEQPWTDWSREPWLGETQAVCR